MSFKAVRTMMGSWVFSRRNSCSTARPLRPGSLTSSSTRSQGCSVMALRPVSASVAKLKEKPAELKRTSRASRTSASSTTTRTLPRASAIVSPGAGRDRRQREFDQERSALAGARAAVDGAAVLLDDAVADGQAQAGAPAGGLGGEEGVVDLAQVLRGDADAGVADLDLDAAVVVAGADGELAALRHGVAGVDQQVQEDLLELAGVAADDRQGLVQLGFHFGSARAQLRLHQAQGVTQGAGQVHLGGLRRRGAGSS